MANDDRHAVPGGDLVAQLVARRRAAGLSQGEVALRMATSQPAVARLEAGLVDARISTLRRYADAVGARLRLESRSPNDR
jgi:predicted transcriptional regulator